MLKPLSQRDLRDRDKVAVGAPPAPCLALGAVRWAVVGDVTVADPPARAAHTCGCGRCPSPSVLAATRRHRCPWRGAGGLALTPAAL
eukprot:scaffold612_cov61-Phaeocystis_antarctica.AAC.1